MKNLSLHSSLNINSVILSAFPAYEACVRIESDVVIVSLWAGGEVIILFV